MSGPDIQLLRGGSEELISDPYLTTVLHGPRQVTSAQLLSSV